MVFSSPKGGFSFITSILLKVIEIVVSVHNGSRTFWSEAGLAVRLLLEFLGGYEAVYTDN